MRANERTLTAAGKDSRDSQIGEAKGAGGSRPLRWGGVARALRHRNYRLFFLGQGSSLVGTWMQRVALSWLVYELTGSEFMLGLVGFSGQICTFLLAPLAGVLADRTDRRQLIVATQVLAMVQAFVLAVLTLSGAITVWQIVALSAVLGLINAFDIPLRQSFVVEMVERREDLPNAIALNSFLVNGAKMLGPSLGGIVVATAGEGVCFLLNGLTFLAVIAALLAMRVRPNGARAKAAHPLTHLKEGLAYAFGFAPIRAILLLLTATSLLGISYTVLLPVYAKDILHGGPRMLGFLTAATGVGALTGAIYLASRTSVAGLGRVMAWAGMLFGLGLMAFAYSHAAWLSLGLLVVIGFGMMIQMVATNTLLQTIVDDDKRGRVMSLYTMAFMGMGPFGSLLAGWVAGRWGAPVSMVMGGMGCLAASAVFATRLPILGRLVHPVYVRRGIVPPPVGAAGEDPMQGPIEPVNGNGVQL